MFRENSIPVAGGLRRVASRNVLLSKKTRAAPIRMKVYSFGISSARSIQVRPIGFFHQSIVGQLIFSRLRTMQMMVIRNSNYLVHARRWKAADTRCELVSQV